MITRQGVVRLEDLGLSKRLHTALVSLGCKTLADAGRIRAEDLSKVTGVGATTLAEFVSLIQSQVEDRHTADFRVLADEAAHVLATRKAWMSLADLAGSLSTKEGVSKESLANALSNDERFVIRMGHLVNLDVEARKERGKIVDWVRTILRQSGKPLSGADLLSAVSERSPAFSSILAEVVLDDPEIQMVEIGGRRHFQIRQPCLTNGAAG